MLGENVDVTGLRIEKVHTLTIVKELHQHFLFHMTTKRIKLVSYGTMILLSNIVQCFRTFLYSDS